MVSVGSIVRVKSDAAEHERWAGCAVLEISCQSGIKSTAGDGHRWPWSSESSVLPGCGCGSVEAMVVNMRYASRRQLRLCKWLCSLVVRCHSNRISNLQCQLFRVGHAAHLWDAQVFLEVQKLTQQSLSPEFKTWRCFFLEAKLKLMAIF